MKKSKLFTLGLLAGAGLLLSINQAQAADTWVKNGSDWNLSQDGSLAKNKWVQNAGSWYYFDDSGNMQTGWLKDGDTWYSLADSGAMRTGWYKEGNTWYSLADSGAMRTGWYKEGNTWYYLHFSGSMMTGWVFIDGNWYYFEQSGAMASDRVVNSSDGTGYILSKDGHMFTLRNNPYKHGDIVRLGDGYEYLITAKFDGNNFTDVIVDKNTWYIKPEFKKFSDKYGDHVSNTTLALIDNKEEGQEIDPKAVIKNFQNLPNRYYFGADGRRVTNLPEMTTYSEIKKVGNDVYLENPGARLRLVGTRFTINNNKLYHLENEQGKLTTGYFVLIDDGATTSSHHVLAYADQSGEILKMKRLPSRFSDYFDKEIDGFYGQKIKITQPNKYEYYKVLVVK
ncbi:cell wall binding repeat family protein [Streptococcus mitis]|uniref:Cell wall binding repeat family protein n=1 Tax=Streptococcus mitis TaxID=28037 RepID=A0A081QJN4_STRMT|nr:N-acetylmuramoyl-L-alanine amidase family protein [Streptococcus mitis]KEQ43157.1 cell wall binding repeat family protein [Streptococcus mitis]